MIRKKLLLVADTFYPKVDGIIRFMEEFSHRSKDHFEISYLAPYFGKRHPHTTFIEPSRWVSLSGYQNMKISWKNIRRIKKTIKENDLVFIQGPALLSFLSIYYSKKLKKKTILYHHIYPWELFAKFAPASLNKILYTFVKKLWIQLYNHCDQILVPYHELVRELCLAKVSSPIAVARLGVDIQLFSPTTDLHASKKSLGISPYHMVIGYVGRISKEKNIDTLLQAFNKISSSCQKTLLLVGDGPEASKEKIKQQVPGCIITGFVKNVHEYLQAMDIFVMPSLTETTSLATLEAMATGLSVVCTKIGFMETYIIKNYNGLFFPKANATLLSIKLEKLINNPELRRKLGSNARKTITYSFSWERSINKIIRILSKISHKP